MILNPWISCSWSSFVNSWRKGVGLPYYSNLHGRYRVRMGGGSELSRLPWFVKKRHDTWSQLNLMRRDTASTSILVKFGWLLRWENPQLQTTVFTWWRLSLASGRPNCHPSINNARPGHVLRWMLLTLFPCLIPCLERVNHFWSACIYSWYKRILSMHARAFDCLNLHRRVENPRLPRLGRWPIVRSLFNNPRERTRFRQDLSRSDRQSGSNERL